MWNDNETEIDLLGFDYLVDSLEILLTEQNLLPMTVGVLGDWGSGKSSLMQLAKARLDATTSAAIPAVDHGNGHPVPEADDAPHRPFITVAFSPWRYENYTQVKYALMDTVLDAIDEHIGDDERDERPQIKLATARRLLARLKPAAVPAAGAAIMAGGLAVGVDPEISSAATTAVAASLPAAVGGASSPGGSEAEPDLIESIARFHVEFEELLESIPDVQAVVVFIDDMDRCEERAIIDTFETIRLFLHATKTAFVLGMNEPVIAAALEARYPERTGEGHSRAQQYVEKMIQHSVAIPPLSQPEALTYISLLFAGQHISGEQFDLLRTAADDARAKNPNAAAMNLGIAREVLNGGQALADPHLERDLEIATQVGGPLATGLRGNPRQIKRFLNRLQLRMAVSNRRSMDLDPQILSKLMVLEELSPNSFETLFVWQNDHDGQPVHVELAEAAAKGRTPKATDATDAATAWAKHPLVHPWLQMEPPLTGVALGPYFTFSRDRLKTSIRASRLSPEQQQMLVRLQATTSALRKAAVNEVLADPNETLALGNVLLEQFSASPDSPGSWSLIMLASSHDGLATAVFEQLGQISAHRLKQTLSLHLAAMLGDDERLVKQVDAWIKSKQLPETSQKAFETHMKDL